MCKSEMEWHKKVVVKGEKELGSESLDSIKSICWCLSYYSHSGTKTLMKTN